jgi:hypothetical protein
VLEVSFLGCRLSKAASLRARKLSAVPFVGSQTALELLLRQSVRYGAFMNALDARRPAAFGIYLD